MEEEGRIGRIIEWYVTVLCRFARNVRAVSELMAAGQMFRGFSAELSCPRAQTHNASDSPACAFIVARSHTRAHTHMSANVATPVRALHAPPARRGRSASANVYITCTVVAAHPVTNAGIMRRNMSVFV